MDVSTYPLEVLVEINRTLVTASLELLYQHINIFHNSSVMLLDGFLG